MLRIKPTTIAITPDDLAAFEQQRAVLEQQQQQQQQHQRRAAGMMRKENASPGMDLDEPTDRAKHSAAGRRTREERIGIAGASGTRRP